MKFTPPLETRYCTKCGAKMIDVPRQVRFNMENGEPIYHIWSHCPNHHHFWDGHNHYVRGRSIYDEANDYTKGKL